MAIKLDKNLVGTQQTDELHNSLGAGLYSLDHDTFFGGADMDIYTAPASGGVHLIEDTHYTLHDEDTDLTTETGITVYTTLKIIDPTYQAVDLYFTYKTVGDYNEAGDINALELKHNLLHIRDEKAQNTGGGAFANGAWRTRDLTVVKTNEIAGASLAANRITLPAGIYWVEWSAPGYQVDIHQSKLYDISGAADLIIGTSAYSSVLVNINDHSFGKGRFTIAVESLIELQHRCSTTNTFGNPCNFTTEVYSDIIIRQVL